MTRDGQIAVAVRSSSEDSSEAADDFSTDTSDGDTSDGDTSEDDPSDGGSPSLARISRRTVGRMRSASSTSPAMRNVASSARAMGMPAASQQTYWNE
jgi:hypothetical protein